MYSIIKQTYKYVYSLLIYEYKCGTIADYINALVIVVNFCKLTSHYKQHFLLQCFPGDTDYITFYNLNISLYQLLCNLMMAWKVD